MKATSKENRDGAPDLNDIALFVDVVRAASFSAAAKSRGVPVSTVSRRMARLESTLGTSLLERTTRRMRLTEVGTRYFEHAERALDQLSEGRQYVRAQHALPRGRVRITAPVGLGRILTEALAPFLLDAPLVTVDIDLTERRVDLIGEGFDIAVRAGPVDTADFVARRIVDSTRGLYASLAYLNRRGRPRRVSDLAEHDLVATHASANGAVWELLGTKAANGAARLRHRVAFKPRLVVNELTAARSAAIAGIGIALLPSLQADGKQLERILPALTTETNGLWLLYPARRPLTLAVRACADHLARSLATAPPP